MSGAVQSIVSNLPSAFAGLAATAIIGVIMFPIRTLLKNARAEWFSATAKLDSLGKELELQRTNCLTTLANQGEAQIKLLEKATDTLDAMHLSQVEMTGFIRAKRDL